jgi:hypothetical protein
VLNCIAVDGLGNVFSGGLLYNTTAPGVLLEYSNSGTLLSPGLGFTGSGFIPVLPEVAKSFAIDGSGNIWISGDSNGSGLPVYVAEVIGIAAPVVTPLSVAVANNTLGTRP